MRALNLARVAAEAEVIRYRSKAGRQGTRAAMGAIAAVFALHVLALLNVTGWQLLRFRFEPLYATLILLSINIVLTGLFGVLAIRSSESRVEIEALHIRQKAIDEMRGSLLLGAVIPLLGTLWRSRRQGSAKRLL